MFATYPMTKHMHYATKGRIYQAIAAWILLRHLSEDKQGPHDP